MADCNFVEGCPMFKYFNRIAAVVYRMAYCQGDYENCARRKLRLANQPVPENLGPQGVRLWPDGEQPPDELHLPGM